MKNKRFIFEIPIESGEYSPETCKEDYGSEANYNKDFPNWAYAFDHIDMLLKDAADFCRISAMGMIVKKKCDVETWEEWERSLYKNYIHRAEYYKDLIQKIRFARAEEL